MLIRWTDILTFSLCVGVVCLAASLQMGLLLGVALHPALYVVPVCVGVLFGTMLVAVRRLWRRSQVATEQARQSALALNQANEALKNLNAVLEERVAERSRQVVSQAEELVLNLVMNARDAMDRGRIEVGCADEGACVRIWVQDEGSGIADAVRDQVFEPFVTTKAQGTGLGLASVRELVHEAQGEITFTTSPQGTRFDVTLPSLSAGEPGAP